MGDRDPSYVILTVMMVSGHRLGESIEDQGNRVRCIMSQKESCAARHSKITLAQISS